MAMVGLDVTADIATTLPETGFDGGCMSTLEYLLFLLDVAFTVALIEDLWDSLKNSSGNSR